MHRSRAILVAAAVLAPLSLSAQGVTVQSTSSVRLYGALGTFARMAARLGGGHMDDVQSTVYVAGHKMRNNSEDHGVIIDVDAERLTNIDDKQKTYSSITFSEMAAAMQQAMDSAKQQGAQRSPQHAEQRKNSNGKSDVTFKYDVKTDRPGQHEKIAGYDAERIFVTISIEADAIDTTKANAQPEQAGTLVLLLDQWRSSSAPQLAAMQEFQRAYAEKTSEVFRPQVEGLKSAFNFDPRIKEGFAVAAKEMAKMSGVVMRQTIYAAVVPPGMNFDRTLVLNDGATPDTAKKEDAPKKGRFGGLMGAIKSAAEQANKNASNKSDSKAEAKQTTLLSVSEQVTNVTSGTPAGVFQPPAGYQAIQSRIPRS